ncbi:MAG TPA: thioredoxin domain-containing protein [Verrucomicrobiae bacterium]|nr:thioredoxin domain-containing protein [Verrucomicrobiae bacterium]
MMKRPARIIVYLLTAVFCTLSSFSGTLAKENKPLVVVVYADWCPYCQHLKPALARINEKYHGQIRFARLDVTSAETTAKSKLLARSLGLDEFFEDNKASTSLVMIQDSSGHEVFRAFHDYEFQHYETVLDRQLVARKPHKN